MKHRIQSWLTLAILFLTVLACKKDDEPAPVAPACLIQKEMVDGHGTYYTYDKEGNPIKIEKYNPYYKTHVLDVFYDKISVVQDNVAHPMTITTKYDAGILTTQPSVALVSTTVDGVTTVNWRTYLFRYDYKGRLIRVGEETENIVGDAQWELLIDYNESDNVIKMTYQFTTGPSTASTVILVDGHDHHETPHAGVKGYKFLMSNWDNSDPGPIITALSKNNPTSFRLFIDGVQTMKISMDYEYNQHGFPIISNVTHNNDAGEYKYEHTYEYVCP
jgi:hypothetical protein